jgi:hypothetical protein
MVWNLCETIFDRKKIDKNWVPVINLERGLHYEWFKQNNDKFKPQFCRFIDDYKSDDPPSMRFAAAKSYIIFGAIISFLLIAAVLIVPAQFERIEYYDHHVEIECAKNNNYKAFNLRHAYDCSKFSPGSIAQLCVDDYHAFNLSNNYDCSRYINQSSS